jgi:hypothetical protein
MIQRSIACACLSLAAIACENRTKALPERDAATVIAATTAPSSEEASRRTVRGTLVHRGEPLRDLPLEICRSGEGNVQHSTPCAQSPHRMTTRTDGSGAFAFTNLSDATYQIFILEPPYHTQTLVNLVVQDGGVFDVGRFEVRAVASP